MSEKISTISQQQHRSSRMEHPALRDEPGPHFILSEEHQDLDLPTGLEMFDGLKVLPLPFNFAVVIFNFLFNFVFNYDFYVLSSFLTVNCQSQMNMMGGIEIDS